MRRALRNTCAKHHVLVSNAAPDAGMQGWSVGMYARVMRGEGVPMTMVLHDHRSRIAGTTDGLWIPMLVRDVLTEDLQHHDGPAVVDALPCLN